jgi:hypothetical protein
MRASLLLLLVTLVCSSSVQAAPYDPYPWCAVYGGSWSGASNCGFKTLQQYGHSQRYRRLLRT